jgi:hypothetical protein
LCLAGGAWLVGCGAGRGIHEDAEEDDLALSGNVSIQAVHSGLCADVTGASTIRGAFVQQWGCSGHANQIWTLKSVGTNTFNLVSANSGLCMDVSGASTTNGARIIQWTCNGGDNQKWKVSTQGAGFRLQAVHSGKCLDVAGVSTAPGAAYQQWTCHSTDTGGNQTFKLNGASGGTTPPPTGGASVSQLLALTHTCSRVVSSHSYALDSGQKTNICGLNGAIFWTADMDIDCDGKRTAQCNENTDCCFQPETAFTNSAGEPLTASVTPYVVIPNDFHISGLDTSNGGNVTAIIFNNKLIYAVFGDTGPTDIIGEASYAAAAKLGINPDPSNGGTGGPVTYITFIGSGTRPSNIEDQSQTQTLGQKLSAQLVQNNP